MDEANKNANPDDLNLDPDHIVPALQLYHEKRDQMLIEQQLMG